MPTVPTYDSAQQQTRALPGVRQSSVASPQLLGGASADKQLALGRSLAGGGDLLMQHATKMQEQQNADMLFQAETTVKTDYLEFEKQARERRGDSAKGLAQDAAAWWDEKARTVGEGLENDRQRTLFKQQVSKLRLQSLDSMSAFEATERRNSLTDSAEASIVSSINLAATQVNTPTEGVAVAGAKDDILKRLAVLKQLNGWTPEVMDVKRAEALTNLHLQVINGKVDKDPAGAKRYFKANKAEINGSKYEAIEKSLSVGNTKAVAQGFADRVVASGMSEIDAIREARAKYSGAEESAVVAEIKTRFIEAGAARDRQTRNAADAAWDIYARTGRLSDIPASVVAELDGRDLHALRENARVASDRTEKPKTNWDVYYDLRQMAFDDPARFANVDLRREFPHLDESERKNLIDLQAKANDTKALTDAATFSQQLSNMRDTLGFGPRDKEKAGRFDMAVTNAVQAEERAKGKKLTYEERQAIMDRLVIQGEVEGSGFIRDDRGRVFELQDRPDFDRFVPTVPKNDRAQIEAAIRKRGGKVTDAEVIRIYKAANGLK